MNELVFLLEEESARAMLENLLPKIAPCSFLTRFIVFEGKNDLERNLAKRIKGYRNPKAIFFVVRDQDAIPDCVRLKKRLLAMCAEAGRPESVVRIACRELESFYLADLGAVEAGLGLTKLAIRQRERKFSNPDRLSSPSRELARLTRGIYQKVGGSRAIGPHLDVNNERSRSFKALVAALRRVCASLASCGNKPCF